MRFLRGLAALLLLAPAAAAAQRSPAVVTGRVVLLDSARAAAAVLVRIESVNAGASTDSAGRYRLVVPGSRFADGDSVTITASRISLRPEQRRIQLAAGANIQVDFGIKKQIWEDYYACDVVFGVPAGTIPHPRRFYYKLCSLTHTLARKLRGRSPAPP